jgi:PBP1b-binding outer membrane lipoprotein LpoB
MLTVRCHIRTILAQKIMRKYLYLIIVWIALFSCVNENTTQTKNNPKHELNTENIQLQDTVQVKKWLIKVITDYVNSEDSRSRDENLKKVLTADYYNYKIDALTLEYSEMTKQEFHDKWKTKYDTTYVGNGGFFTSVNDNGNVEVTVCRLLKINSDNSSIFHTVVHDLRWNTNYDFDIKIISKDNNILIDDVQERKYGT